mmetsp:Transcript_33474/g.44173  ORF Transcript_33474/g.44173 Transcript_33474/m.44173 type:complete len:268 (+) Transcript_33474:532-1335(+)
MLLRTLESIQTHEFFRHRISGQVLGLLEQLGRDLVQGVQHEGIVARQLATPVLKSATVKCAINHSIQQGKEGLVPISHVLAQLIFCPFTLTGECFQWMSDHCLFTILSSLTKLLGLLQALRKDVVQPQKEIASLGGVEQLLAVGKGGKVARVQHRQSERLSILPILILVRTQHTLSQLGRSWAWGRGRCRPTFTISRRLWHPILRQTEEWLQEAPEQFYYTLLVKGGKPRILSCEHQDSQAIPMHFCFGELQLQVGAHEERLWYRVC